MEKIRLNQNKRQLLKKEWQHTVYNNMPMQVEEDLKYKDIALIVAMVGLPIRIVVFTLSHNSWTQVNNNLVSLWT